jgi:O-antigen/teichoic acid export membrane protein
MPELRASGALHASDAAQAPNRAPWVGVESGDDLVDQASHSASPETQGLSVRHNFAWTLAGNITYAACQWAVIVLLAKLGNTEMVGRFALALAVAYPITYIAHLQLRVIYVTDLRGKYPANEMLGLRLALSVLAIAILLATCAVAKYNAATTLVILIVGIAQLADCISENYFAIAQRHERMDRIARSQMIRSLLSLTFVATILYFTRSLLWAVCGYVFGRIIILLTYDAGQGTFALGANLRRHLSYFERIVPRWNLRKQLDMAWVALPLGVVSVLGSLNSNMPRYFIEKSLGPSDLGIYSALTYIPSASLLIASALGYAVFARLSKLFFTGDLKGFKIVLAKACGVCLGLGIFGLLCGAVIGRQVLEVLYRPEYAEHVDLLVWLLGVGAVGCVASCLGCAMSAASQFKIQVPLFIVVTGSAFAASAVLIPRLGLKGAALAALASMSVQLLGTSYVIYRAIEKRARTQDPTIAVVGEPALESQ